MEHWKLGEICHYETANFSPIGGVANNLRGAILYAHFPEVLGDLVLIASQTSSVHSDSERDQHTGYVCWSSNYWQRHYNIVSYLLRVY